MAIKAVFNNQHLAVYVTGQEFSDLLVKGIGFAPLYYGRVKSSMGEVLVALNVTTSELLADWTRKEYEAMEAARAEGYEPMKYVVTQQQKGR